MDWNSEEGRALLWQAYPGGFLARQGVVTIGGWLCIEFAKNEFGWVYRSHAMTAVTPHCGVLHAIHSGIFLPLPDPKDTATWACLLADLADAIGIDMTPVLALAWTPCKYKVGPQIGWALDYICATPTECWRVVFAPELTGERVTYVFPRHEMWDQPWHTTPSAGVEALIRCRAALYNANVVRVDKKLY